MSVNIMCGGPGPHLPPSGILGQAETPITGMLCQSSACQAAVTAAQTAAQGSLTNQASLQAALDLRLGQIEAFIAANPSGAVLTAAQTLVVAKMLAGLTRVVRNAISTTGQAG